MKPIRLGLLIAFLFPACVAAAQTKGSPSGKIAGAANAAGFQALVKKADAAREADQSDEAIRLYQQVVRTKPGFAEGWWYLGTLFYEGDQYADGRAAFRHVTGLKPEISLGWAMLGLCEFETKDFDNALVHLERADQLKIPSDQGFYDVARYHLALLLTRAGRFEHAIHIMADFASHGKEGPQFTQAMGLASLRKPLLPNELPPAEREMVLDVGRAICEAASRHLMEAEKDRAEMLRKYPDTPEVHFLAGSLLLASDADKALDEWKAELAISPEHPRALVSIAGEYAKRGEYATALPYAERAVAANPGFFSTHAVLGQVLAEGDLDVVRGIRELEIALRLAPTQPQVHFALATAYTRGGRKEDAARERAEFLKLRSQDQVAVSRP